MFNNYFFRSKFVLYYNNAIFTYTRVPIVIIEQKNYLLLINKHYKYSIVYDIEFFKLE